MQDTAGVSSGRSKSNKSLLVSGGEHRETILYPIPIDTPSSPTYIIWPLGGVLFKALAMDLTAILFLKAAPSAVVANLFVDSITLGSHFDVKSSWKPMRGKLNVKSVSRS
jgi:hypothetical protein